MKLHRLELTGFGPFRNTQIVDFDAFETDGIFLIAGRTGAGKSSVLDGVCFGLYGGVPRYEGSERRLRSDHCDPADPTRVVVEFTAGDTRWRVTRSPEYDRPKQRGTGMTTEPHRAQLDEWIDGEWVGRAARPVDVARDLDEILGLNQQQFLQVILLAQNRFAEFLLAKNDDRQRLLRRLFGTRTYEGYQTALDERRRAAEAHVTSAGEGVQMLLAEAEAMLAADGLEGIDAEATDPGAAAVDAGAGTSLEDRIAAVARGVQRAAYRADSLRRESDEAEATHRAADRAHTDLVALRDAQTARARARDALAAREAEQPAVDADRSILDAAREAEELRPVLEAEAAAEIALSSALATEERALAQWQTVVVAIEADHPHEPDADDLVAIIDAAAATAAVAEAARDAERDLERWRGELEGTQARIAASEAAQAELEAQAAAVPLELAALDHDLAVARDAAGGRDAALQRVADLESRRTAAQEVIREEAGLRDAEALYLARTTEHDSARTAVTDLLRRRLAGYAGELAAALAPGEPCDVCGSTEHPAPARHDGEPVTDDEMHAAERARDAAATAEQQAARHANEARDRVAAMRERSGGETEEALTAALTEARAAAAAADAAAARRDELVARRSRLAETVTEVAAERDQVRLRLSAERERAASLRAEIGAAEQTVDRARGDYATVAACQEAAETRRAAAEALRRARDESARAHAARDEAIALTAAALESTRFDGPVDAAAALRDRAARAQLESRITDHEVALRTERDRVREWELKLAGIADEPVDVDAAAATAAAARDAWSAALDAASRAAQRAAHLRELAERAEDAQRKIGDLAAEAAAVTRLAHTVAGRAPNTHRMTLESFVLAAELEEIVAAANLRLDEMSAGRYRLQHSDALAARGAASGLGLQILDAHTGRPRPASSLSGGETFLASLALALGLAEVVTARAGGVRLDTLFIDEGFGSLDDETLDLAMRTLDELRQGGRTVGLISHVAAMKEQIPAQLLVEASAQGPSVIRQDVAVPTPG
ncbi:SMC family ATPase [Microbacterium sp. NPDC077184]|uniref:SMC family ATPase n=1 Tax=Microbacterium sp. NPDC077184 TaxID=3154764 RepID=UPI00343AA998